ncbi:putative pyruvate dehydrogenase [Actinoplanes missouriensis 431]|uniref:Putative pyruvate dehydrogenase n=1 Tax=Actinoplanes missouriensis (strain ATCC 14538 / DSM 43046 / CBS 188.64 / JCM 3121 / NBRC 102363 / NCIMB 12654 / NRRL B-3342 / UNCC 431) TaxID=512565 RepID=I0HG52_ACTM4|nr:pyruvate dehydrogenase [Actinoplanes missouriensis]BAL91989.1 putative pyruvate dehydrogenase [Actinoplanes missouriensis 431]
MFGTKQTVADQFVEVLVQAGVERIYGIVGDSLNSLSDAIRRSGAIEWVHVHNEEAAAFAASAEAQLTGRLAVCAGSCGPGNTHLIQGVFDAHRSGAPVLAIASHIVSTEIGTGFFQETDPKQLFGQASHFTELVSSPEQMPRMARVAIQEAVGKRGAAVLVMPGDVLSQHAVNETGTAHRAAGPVIGAPAPEVIEELAERINQAETVAIFGGIGAAGARDDVLQLADVLAAPVGHTLRGKESLQYDNPFDVGMSGLLGYGACYQASHEADLLILLGTDFPYRQFLPGKNTVQVDIDPSRLGRRTPLDQGVAGDVGATIRALLPKLNRKKRDFLDRMLAKHNEELERVVGAYTHDVEHLTPIHPEYVASVLDEEAASDAIFTADTGMCCSWIARYITPNGHRRLLGSWVHGTMANALPQALGAQKVFPERQVVSMSGDGGLAMLLGELLTAKLHNLPVKVVVFNNSSLGMVRLEMLVAGDPPFETDHAAVDFAAIARGAGILGVRVEKPAELRRAMREFLDHDGPAVLDVVTDPNALELPPHITKEEAAGFALAVGRTVLGGGVGQMLHLARTNLRNIPR